VAGAPVAVIGGGVVGAAVAYSLARRGVAVVLLEAGDELGLAASGTNSGILHTGFDSPPGELETELILRSAKLREPVLARLGVPVLRCGAVVTPRDEAEARIVVGLAENARANGVEAILHHDGRLEVPGEAVTDPVAYTLGLADMAERLGAQVRTRSRVARITPGDDGLSLGVEAGGEVRCRVAVNCAGLHADEVARMVGDDSFSIYPRKGEFFVFEPPEPLERILLPVPTKRTKGVLVFPSIDGRVIAGPTAHDQDDKADWSVRDGAHEEVLAKARGLWPPLERARETGSYAGLRPAGRDGANYVIGPSPACARLINVAAIRSTGLSASLGIGEHVSGLVAEQGVELGEPREAPAAVRRSEGPPWWRRSALHREGAA
jgi:glycerol-3-phosphate dehydrogenase